MGGDSKNHLQQNLFEYSTTRYYIPRPFTRYVTGSSNIFTHLEHFILAGGVRPIRVLRAEAVQKRKCTRGG